MVEPIILPVVRVERALVPRPAALPAGVTDINAFRYSRERRAVERREQRSLLPDLGSPCDCGD